MDCMGWYTQKVCSNETFISCGLQASAGHNPWDIYCPCIGFCNAVPWKQKRGKRLPCVKRKPAEVESWVWWFDGFGWRWCEISQTKWHCYSHEACSVDSTVCWGATAQVLRVGDGPGGKSEEEIHGNCDFSPKMNVFSLKIPRSLKGNVSPFFLCGEGGGGNKNGIRKN